MPDPEVINLRKQLIKSLIVQTTPENVEETIEFFYQVMFSERDI